MASDQRPQTAHSQHGPASNSLHLPGPESGLQPPLSESTPKGMSSNLPIPIIIPRPPSSSNSDADFHHNDHHFTASIDEKPQLNDDDADSFAFLDGPPEISTFDDSASAFDGSYHRASFDTLQFSAEPEVATVHTANFAVNFGAQLSAASYKLPAHISQRLSQNPGQGQQLVQIPQSPTLNNYRASLMNPMATSPTRATAPATEAGHVTPGYDDGPFVRNALDAITRDGGVPMSLNVPATQASEVSAAITRQMQHGVQPVRQTQGSGYDDKGDYTADHQAAAQTSGRLVPVPRNQPQLDRGVPVQSQYIDSVLDHASLPSPPPPPPPQGGSFASGYGAASSFTGSGRPGGSRFSTSNWVPVTESVVTTFDPKRVKYPKQGFVPAILRLPSFLLLGALVAAMTAVMIYCAVRSKHNDGLQNYPGSINSSSFFVYRILPAMVSAVILLYTQALIMATFRLLPFARMAEPNPVPRSGAIFQNMYPRSFLWPDLTGPAQIKYCIFVAWLMNFAIPLHSAGFVVKYYSGQWRWTAVQAVTWTLVALYVMLLSALAVLAQYWFGRNTGVMWDVRCIADIVPMLNHSNVKRSYVGTQHMATRRELMAHLENHMIDRLGYWAHDGVDMESSNAAFWHAVGRSFFQESEVEEYEKRKQIKGSGTATWVVSSSGRRNSPPMTGNSSGAISTDQTLPGDRHLDSRYGYLPWCMRTTQVVAFVAIGAMLFVAMLVVSFIQQTRLTHGFLPELPTMADGAGFSPANFLYSFVLGLLGQVLFLLFQAYELTLRQLAPWAELKRHEGSPARKSILADYAACVPGQAGLHALRNGHYVVAAMSTASTLFVLIPVLAGGLLIALTEKGTTQVRMYPSVPVLGTVVALLGVYVGCLAGMLWQRQRHGDDLRMPHGVMCLAEVFSFTANEEVTADAAFRAPKSKADMVERLGAGGGAQGRTESLWYFGVEVGKDESLGVHRVRQFAEKKVSVDERTM